MHLPLTRDQWTRRRISILPNRPTTRIGLRLPIAEDVTTPTIAPLGEPKSADPSLYPIRVAGGNGSPKKKPERSGGPSAADVVGCRRLGYAHAGGPDAAPRDVRSTGGIGASDRRDEN